MLALDIGGTKLAAGVVDATGARPLVPRRAEPGRRGAGPDAGAALRARAAARSRTRIAWDEIGAVGIGCGGPLDADRGILIAPPHLPGWRNVPIADARRARVRPARDARERRDRGRSRASTATARGPASRNMVYLTISTGVGGGVVIDGRLYRGPTGNGGELGHVTVDWHGRRCRGCGRRGCLEAYVSGTSIAERAREAGLEHATRGGGRRSGARGRSPARARVWDETVEALACGLTSIVNLFEPELVVVGGGVGRAGEQLLGPVRGRGARAGDRARPAARSRSSRGARRPGRRRRRGGDRVRPSARVRDGWSADAIEEHVELAGRIEELLPQVEAVARRADRASTSAAAGVYTFGNGGSAADAQHLAGELRRRASSASAGRSPAQSLSQRTRPTVTCIANDYSFDDVFARQVGRSSRAGRRRGRLHDERPLRERRRAGSRRRARPAPTTVLFGGGDGGRPRSTPTTRSSSRRRRPPGSRRCTCCCCT